jgi:hypothetical protein
MTQKLPPIGEWDGVTKSAHLSDSYEDPAQAKIPFGVISYFNQPWRAYMDTWPASHYLQFPGLYWNIPDKYADAICTLMDECGIHYARVEIGWGSLGWDDQFPQDTAQKYQNLFRIFKTHHIRPIILLNAHHGIPCPMKDFHVQLTEDALKGSYVLHFKSIQGVRPMYMGLPNPDYIACKPLITSVDTDGTVHLSSALPYDIKAGDLRLQVWKYQPLQGPMLKDGEPVPASQETLDGWLKYADAVGELARSALGGVYPRDSGFDIEVWNEQSFGSDFLDINKYFDKKREYAKPIQYNHQRKPEPGLLPGAKMTFTSEGYTSLLPMTVDFFRKPQNGFHGVQVISGFSNQWPWDNGDSLWDGQAGFSRHYYTGGWQDCSPKTPLSRPDQATVDALGNLDGKKTPQDWNTIVPGTNFIPTFRCSFPEYFHSGFKTESLSRDVMPDSHLSYFAGHGRYTNNGDLHPAEVWETEVNWWRRPFFDDLIKKTGVKENDPRMIALDRHIAGKLLLRQYIFHCSKGLYRITVFCSNQDPLSFGVFPPAIFQPLDQSGGNITPDVRAALPPEFIGLKWLYDRMKMGVPMAATEALKVKDLVEYKPRLVFAGDGTPEHPSKWNRDFFAFLPFQLNPNEYIIPYYVVTLNITHSWNKNDDLLNPSRYDMPDQDFDVVIGNLNGKGASVSVYDPLKNVYEPVTVLHSSNSELKVRLKTVDYPRFLRVVEKNPGPAFVGKPKMTVDRTGKLSLQWKTNIPVLAKVTYGWTKRDQNMVKLPARAKSFQFSTFTGIKGVVAVRIWVNANGLTTAWPRWDEDPNGQMVTP